MHVGCGIPACGILVPGPGTEPSPLALEEWSLNHCIPWEVPLSLLVLFMLAVHFILCRPVCWADKGRCHGRGCCWHQRPCPFWFQLKTEFCFVLFCFFENRISKAHYSNSLRKRGRRKGERDRSIERRKEQRREGRQLELGSHSKDLLFIYLYWSIVDLQFCVNLYCAANDSVIHIYICIFKYSFPLWFTIGHWI